MNPQPQTTDDGSSWWQGAAPPAEWEKTINDDWLWHKETRNLPSGSEVHLGWYKQGNCPRCGHTMTIRAKVGRAFRVDQDYTGFVTKKRVRCNCTAKEHEPSRPKDFSDGCGVVGMIDPPGRSQTGAPTFGRRAKDLRKHIRQGVAQFREAGRRSRTP